MVHFANIAVVLYFSFEFCSTAPPTLDDVSRKQCPPDKPFKCLPYGKCYNADSYCHNVSGTPETCFPQLSLGGSLLEWCREQGQYNATLMRNKFACSLACQARFNSSELSEDLQKLSQKVCPENQPHKCPGDNECYGSFEFCDSGEVKSCFPDGIETVALLDWCRERGQFDISLMNNNGCTLACEAKFKYQDLLHVSETPESFMVPFAITLTICIVQFMLLCLVRHSLCKTIQVIYRKYFKYQDKQEVPNIEETEEFRDLPPIKIDQKKILVGSHESQPGTSRLGSLRLGLLRRQTSTNPPSETDGHS